MHRHRSIPACAGEPVSHTPSTICCKVYPRVCRGNLPAQIAPAPPARSIPACAGEPRRRDAPVSPRWVYPRVCGGTAPLNSANAAFSGLSPRVRGNRWMGGGRPAV